MYPDFDSTLNAFIEGIENGAKKEGREKTVISDAFDDFVVIGVIREKEEHVMNKLSVRWLGFLFDMGIMDGKIYEVDKDFVLIVAEKLELRPLEDCGFLPELVEIIWRAPWERTRGDIARTVKEFFELNPRLKDLTDMFSEKCPFDDSRIDIKRDNFGFDKNGNPIYFDLFI